MLSILKELISFIRARKKYWLLPVMILLVVLGGLVVAAKGSAVAPFIYAIF